MKTDCGATIHTWPEYRYAAVDVFTCGDVIKPDAAVAYLASRFCCKNPAVVEMKRGIIAGLTGKVSHKLPAEEKVGQGASHGAQELTSVH